MEGAPGPDAFASLAGGMTVESGEGRLFAIFASLELNATAIMLCDVLTANVKQQEIPLHSKTSLT